jgi:hypothetical protein
MAFNLIDTVRNYITPEVEERAASHLGESREAIHKAVGAAVPALFYSYAHRAESGDAAGLFADAKAAATHNLAESSATLFAGGATDQPKGSPWGGNLLGGNFDSLLGAIATYSGVKRESANSLMGLLGPLSLGALGQHAIDRNLDANGLSSFLSGQKSAIQSALPQGLNTGLQFTADPRVAATPVTDPSTDPLHREHRKGGKTNWIWLVLLALVILALIIYLTMGRGDRDANPTTEPADTTGYNTTPG